MLFTFITDPYSIKREPTLEGAGLRDYIKLRYSRLVGINDTHVRRPGLTSASVPRATQRGCVIILQTIVTAPIAMIKFI